MQVGSRIDEAGVLLREDEAFYFRHDARRRVRLDMRRVSDPRTGEAIRITGVYVGDDLVDVDAIEALSNA